MVNAIYVLFILLMILFSIRHWYYVHRELGRYKREYAVFPKNYVGFVDDYKLTKVQYTLLEKRIDDTEEPLDIPVMYDTAKSFVLNTYLRLVLTLLLFTSLVHILVLTFSVTIIPLAGILPTILIFLNLWKCQNVVKKLDDDVYKPTHVYVLSSER